VFTVNIPAQTYSVTSTVGTGVANSDGSQTITTTSTTATFSTKDSNLGQFLGATVQTTTMAVASNGWDTSLQVGPTTNVGYVDAAKAIGYSTLARVASDAGTPSFADHFATAVVNDARTHPGKYAFAAAEVGMLFTPLPEAYAAYEGVKAFGEAAFAAWHVAWEAGW
jgi:hypothetical protein